MNDHGELTHYTLLDDVVKAQVVHQRCILDGEMLVWNEARYSTAWFCQLYAQCS